MYGQVKQGKLGVSQVRRQKCISNYRNEAFNKTPMNIGNTASVCLNCDRGIKSLTTGHDDNDSTYVPVPEPHQPEADTSHTHTLCGVNRNNFQDYIH